MNKKKQILVVAAHPDDDVLGCGGTIARKSLVERCYSKVCFLSHGVGARRISLDNLEDEMDKKRKQAELALNTLGVEKEDIIWPYSWPCYEYPDNQFDSVPLLSIIKSVETIIKREEPNIIFTHSMHDLNIDHRIVYQAVITATKPWSSSVEEIYSFEIPSSTEWNYPTKFSPNVFYSLSKDDIDRKQEALSQYKDEIRDYPHPRSKKGILINAQNWGMKSGTDYAEAFELVRIVK